MVHLFRRFQQPLMIMITVLVIIAFVWLYNDTRYMDRMGADHVGTIYGRPVTLAQAQKIVRKFDLSQILRLDELLRALAIREQGAKENFIWNDLVLKHEADRLGVEPTDDEVVAAIQKHPAFQVNGAYDPNQFHTFVGLALGPRGLTEGDLEDLIRDDLRVKRIKEILGASAPPTDSEVRAAFGEMYQKLDVSLVRLNLADYLASVQVSEDDLKKLYEKRKASLITDELRKVKFAAFILPTTDKPLEGAARGEALQKFQKSAENMAVAMTEKDAKFEEAAAKAGVKVEESPEFSRAKPPAELGASSDVVTAAFALTKEQPNSDALGTDRGYYVLQLASITQARPLTFDEAKARLTEDLKQERAQEALNLKATEIRNKIDAEIKAGKPFAEAAQVAGAKVESFPPFSQDEFISRQNSTQPDGFSIMQTAMGLNEGDTSQLIPSATGGLLIHLDKREPIDEAKFTEKKAQAVEGVADLKRAILFQEWLKLRRTAAELKTGSRG